MGAHPTGAVYVELYRRSCDRRECPVCYQRWASREARAAAHLIEVALQLGVEAGRPIHVVLSPPDQSIPPTLEDYRRQRTRLYSIAKAAGVRGGCAIYHPWRVPGKHLGHTRCREGPHWHILGFGYVAGGEAIAALYERSGWVVKNLGVRKSVYATVRYCLTHCGIAEGLHALTWWGSLSYAEKRLAEHRKVPTDDPPGCPICGRELEDLEWLGPTEPPFGLVPEGSRLHSFLEEAWANGGVCLNAEPELVRQRTPPDLDLQRARCSRPGAHDFAQEVRPWT